MMSEADKEAVAKVAEVAPETDGKDGEGEPARGCKRSAPDSTNDIQVSSANDWEHADLGDHGRKNKFLRLMGASKKDHHGQFVIGDNERASDRTADQTSHLSENLEHQYEQSMAHKLQGGPRGHIGFGFEKTDEVPADSEKAVSSSENTAADTHQVTDAEAPKVTDSETPQVTDAEAPQVTDAETPQVTDTETPQVTDGEVAKDNEKDEKVTDKQSTPDSSTQSQRTTHLGFVKSS